MELRRLKKEDLATRVEWMNNPAIYRGMHFTLPITLDSTREWFERNMGNNRRADMVLLDNSEIVAFCGITNIDPILKKGESYTFVNPTKRHRGIGTCARILLLDYAFTDLQLIKVFCYTNEDNISSINLSKKLGFTVEGRLRKEYINDDGELKDRLYLGLLKEDWSNDNK